MSEMSRHKKCRVLRSAESCAWNMRRSIYPICELLMDTDFELYKEFGIQQQYRDVVAVLDKLEQTIQSMHRCVAGEEGRDD